MAASYIYQPEFLLCSLFSALLPQREQRKLVQTVTDSECFYALLFQLVDHGIFTPDRQVLVVCHENILAGFVLRKDRNAPHQIQRLYAVRYSQNFDFLCVQ